MSPKFFGREPALWLALVAVAVKLATAFGLDLSTDQQAYVNVVAATLVGLLVAFAVHDGMSAAILGFVQAVVAAAVGFGLDWSADRQAVVMSFAAAVVAMFVRTQVVAPTPAAALSAPPAATPDRL